MELPRYVRLYLLKIIHHNGNIEPLSELGYEYSQIINFLNNEILESTANYVKGKLTLTDKGIELLSQLEKEKGVKNGYSKWIEPEIQSKIERIDKNDIFLPNQNDLNLD